MQIDNWINVIQSVVEERMCRCDAAHQLALTERQTQRLMNRLRESGASWPGKPSTWTPWQSEIP